MILYIQSVSTLAILWK